MLAVKKKGNAGGCQDERLRKTTGEETEGRVGGERRGKGSYVKWSILEA